MRRILYSTGALGLISSAGAAAGDAQAFVERAIRRLGVQADMPGPLASEPVWLDWLSLGLTSDTLKLLLWGTVLLGVFVTAWSLRDSLPAFSRSRRIVAPDGFVHGSDPSARMDEARLEADDLAEQGQYGEAMHVLLLNSLAEIRLRLGTSFAASLTSREILRRVSLPQTGSRAFGAIVQSVERTYFGGKPASRDEYLGCRQEFDMLKRSLAVGPA